MRPEFQPSLQPAVQPLREAAASGRAAGREAAAGPARPPVPASPPREVSPVSAPLEVSPEEAAVMAARQLFAGRDVAVSSFLDEATGRRVYQVADRATGEVLSQSPPEPLLRLYAAMRAEQLVPPVVAQA